MADRQGDSLPINALRRQLTDVVIAAQAHDISMLGRNPPKLGKALEALPVVIRSRCSEMSNGVIGLRQFRAKVVRIADVQEPAASLFDGDAAVPKGVSEQWDKQHAGINRDIDAPRRQPEPFGGAAIVVRLPTRLMIKVRCGVTRMTRLDVRELFLREVDLRARKVRKSSGVIGVAMREDDVSHGGGADSLGFESPRRSVAFIELEAGAFHKFLAQPTDGVADIQKPDARVDEHRFVTVAESEAMTDHGGVGRNQERAAVDVENAGHV